MMLGTGWMLFKIGSMAGLCKSGNEPPDCLKAKKLVNHIPCQRTLVVKYRPNNSFLLINKNVQYLLNKKSDDQGSHSHDMFSFPCIGHISRFV